MDWSVEEPDAYEDGYEAARRNSPRAAAITPPDVRAETAWYAGFDAAQAAAVAHSGEGDA